MKGVNFIHHNDGEYIYEFDFKKGIVEVLELGYQVIEKHNIQLLQELPSTNLHRDLLIEIYSKHQMQ